MIQNEMLPIEFWEFQLGVGYVYYGVSKNVKYSAPYPEYGEKLWRRAQSNLHDIFCDKLEPKESIKELLDGDIRTIADGILSIIIATYEVTLAIGVPLTAIVMKKGIYKFCSTKAKSKKKMNLKEVIENKSLKK